MMWIGNETTKCFLHNCQRNLQQWYHFSNINSCHRLPAPLSETKLLHPCLGRMSMAVLTLKTDAPHPTQQPKISISLLIQMAISYHCTTSNPLPGHVSWLHNHPSVMSIIAHTRCWWDTTLDDHLSGTPSLLSIPPSLHHTGPKQPT